MDSPRAATRRKKMTKQLTGKRDDTALHAAARAGQVASTREMLSGKDAEELAALLSRQNQAGETPLFVAAEYGYVDLVAELIKCHDVATASIKARNGYVALHIAAKQGDVDVVRELLQALPQLSMTVDASNTTALNTAATQGHMDVAQMLLQVDGSLALIARSKGKTALHSAARNGHVEVVRALLDAEPSIALRTDKKGQTALHMAAKGTRLDLVDALLSAEPALLNLTDTKDNTALHIAARKARHEIIKRLLAMPEINMNAINRSRETPLDTAEKMGNAEVAELLAEQGVLPARAISPGGGGGKQAHARELKQQVSDIKHEVHSQLEQTRQACADARDRQADQQAPRGRAQQRHQLHHGGGRAHRHGGVSGHLHGAGGVRGGPGEPGTRAAGRRGQHLAPDGLHHLLRLRLGLALHLSGRGGGADVGGGHREEGQEADDGGDQQAHVGGLRAHQRLVPGALVRGGGPSRAVAGRVRHHHGRHHPGDHHRDHALLGHRAPGRGQADAQHQARLAQPIALILLLRHVGERVGRRGVQEDVRNLTTTHAGRLPHLHDHIPRAGPRLTIFFCCSI